MRSIRPKEKSTKSLNGNGQGKGQPLSPSPLHKRLATWLLVFVASTAGALLLEKKFDSLYQWLFPTPTSERTGRLTHASEPTPAIATRCLKGLQATPGTLALVVGSNVFLLANNNRAQVLTIDGEPVIYIFRHNLNYIDLYATLHHKGEKIADISGNNEFVIEQRFSPVYKPDAASIVLLDSAGAELMYVKYVNQTTIEIRGTYSSRANRSTVVIDADGLRLNPTRQTIRGACFKDNGQGVEVKDGSLQVIG